MALVERLPTLAEVFEDAAQPPVRFTATGKAEIATFDRYSGTACIKVSGPDAAGALANLNLPISENPRFGEYRYIRFAWRKRGGREIALDLNFDVSADGKLATTGIHKHIHGMGPATTPDRGQSRDPNTRKGNLAIAMDQVAADGGNAGHCAQLRMRYFFGPRDIALDDARSIQFGERARSNGTWWCAIWLRTCAIRTKASQRAAHQHHFDLPRRRLRPARPHLSGPHAARFRPLPAPSPAAGNRKVILNRAGPRTVIKKRSKATDEHGWTRIRTDLISVHPCKSVALYFVSAVKGRLPSKRPTDGGEFLLGDLLSAAGEFAQIGWAGPLQVQPRGERRRGSARPIHSGRFAGR